MKKLFYLLLTIVLIPQAYAQLPFGVSVGGRVGTETKDGKSFVGGQAEVRVLQFIITPNVEYYLNAKNASRYDINFDGLYKVVGVGVAQIYAGGGYIISTVNPDAGKSKSFSGYNAQIGGRAGLGGITFFALIKYMRIDGKGDQGMVAGVNFGF
ncbi:MAG: hypothetical protein KDC45_01745 [Bacteroidetes bacterium]|nr:hypothetical protein [Bacteroidota bacterium]